MTRRADILFLAGGKDFHAMDKFRLASETYGGDHVLLVTDTIEGEGQRSHIRPSDWVEHLYIIDGLTPGYQSTWVHLWRNILKLMLIPVQSRRLRRIYDRHRPGVVHAVPMYYMVLCWYARIPFVGTPQGDEILVRPFRSRFYRWMAEKALHAAHRVAVDSMKMKETIERHFGRDAILIKNGFRTADTLSSQMPPERRTRVLSARGIQALYRTVDILRARDRVAPDQAIDVVFPFFDQDYKQKVEAAVGTRDVMHGRLERDQLYRMMGEAALVVSIPTGDSSPRSVYEAIFCGAAVALAPDGFIDELPACMRARVFVVDLSDPAWFAAALRFAREVVRTPYRPSTAALEMCDEGRLFQSVMRHLYRMEIPAAPASRTPSHVH
jgi:hypothetical protein